MKKIVLLFMLSAVLISCKNTEEKNTEAENPTTENVENLQAFRGDYIDSNGALVLMGSDFIYGVKRNEMATKLSQQVAVVKKNDFDMVEVIVRGTLSKNEDTESEWEKVITIKEIMRVSDTPSEADIKFEETAKNK